MIPQVQLDNLSCDAELVLGPKRNWHHSEKVKRGRSIWEWWALKRTQMEYLPMLATVKELWMVSIYQKMETTRLWRPLARSWRQPSSPGAATRTCPEPKAKSVASGDKSKGKGQGRKPGVVPPAINLFQGEIQAIYQGTKQSKSGKGSSQVSFTQRQRLESSLCLGCGASDHWLRDCPTVTLHQAHVCSATTTLDGDGTVVWMVNSEQPGCLCRF